LHTLLGQVRLAALKPDKPILRYFSAITVEASSVNENKINDKERKCQLFLSFLVCPFFFSLSLFRLSFLLDYELTTNQRQADGTGKKASYKLGI